MTMRFPRTRYLFPLTVFALLLTTLAHADFQDGMDGYNRGDYEAALKEWLPLAKTGNAEVLNVLGGLYLNGHGVPQDYSIAVRWFRLAAEQGLAEAQSKLGSPFSVTETHRT